MADDRLRSCPRYRVEHRHPDLAAFIVGFSDTPLVAHGRLELVRLWCRRRRIAGELVLVEQAGARDRELLCVAIAEPRPSSRDR